MSLKDGRATGSNGESEAGAGVHEGQDVIHPAVSGRERSSSDHTEGREEATPGGGAGDEVRHELYLYILS